MNYTRLVFTIVLAIDAILVFAIWSNAYVYAQKPSSPSSSSSASPTPKQTNSTGNSSSSVAATNAPIVLKPLPGGACPAGYHLISGAVCIKNITAQPPPSPSPSPPPPSPITAATPPTSGNNSTIFPPPPPPASITVPTPPAAAPPTIMGTTPQQAAPSPSANNATTKPPLSPQIPQEQQQAIIPRLIPGPQQQRPPPPQQVISPVQGFTANGTIDSVIFTPKTKWIATGNWNMAANNGSLTAFVANMTWYNNNGTALHTHELQNLIPLGKVTVQPDNSIFVKGLMDVGTNHRITWRNVHSTVDIKGGKTITISVDDRDTNNHFAGQPVYGVVTSLTRCSDIPGPNMEVLPPCTNSSGS